MAIKLSKNMTLWVLLIFVSKIAFAIAPPLSPVPLKVEAQEHQAMLSMSKDHCDTANDKQVASQQTTDTSDAAHCPEKCDCNAGHCSVTALIAGQFKSSEKSPQFAARHIVMRAAVARPSSRFRPPIFI